MSGEALRQELCRMRRRYRELLREELAQTVLTPGEVEEEIQYLFAVLAR
jgi:RNA polymerase sigma-70 factor (ECF subfamily)